MQTSHAYLLEVVPLVRIPLTRDQAFFYTGKSSLQTGTIVHIPIGKRVVKGVVISCKKDFARAGGRNLKTLKDVLSDSPLTKKQLALAQEMSRYYLTPLGVVLKNFLQQSIRPRTKDHVPTIKPHALPTLGTMERAALHDAQKILKQKNHCLVQTTHNALATEWLVTFIATTRKKSSKSIVLFVPERTLIPLYEHLLYSYFPSGDIIVLATHLTKGHFCVRSRSIATKKHKIILTTRVGLFAPFRDLSLVVTLESHDHSHKQWAKNPRYDLRTCAPELARIYGAQYLSVSPSPRIAERETAMGTKTFVALPANNVARLSIIDMRMEYVLSNEHRRTKVRPCISDKLLHALTQNIQRKEQSLLFINHQGNNAFSTCAKCKTVLRCPTCERALVERASGAFSCLHCSYKTTVFPHCPACGNITFVNVGTGTEGIESLLRKHLPTATIARVDQNTMKKPRAYYRTFHDFYTGNIDILIGTQMATKGWDVPRLTLAAIIDMDQLLGGRDYDTDEKAYAHILQLSSRVGMRGQLLIQVFDTAHSVITAAKNMHERAFAQEELAMRNLLGYPPYAQLIKVVHRDASRKKCAIYIDALYEKLLSCRVEHDVLTISEPHEPLVNKVRTQYRMQIIITIKKSSKQLHPHMPSCLYNILTALPTTDIVDVDPSDIS